MRFSSKIIESVCKVSTADEDRMDVKKTFLLQVIILKGTAFINEIHSLLHLIFYELISLLIVKIHASAQTTRLAYEKGDQLIKAGFGLGAPFSTGSLKTPPLQGIYEYGISEDISIGGLLGYASSAENYASLGKIDYSYLIFGARANYHFETGEKFDPYGGAILGYYNVGFKDHGGYVGNFATSSIIYGVQLGVNYYFNNKLGAWVEVGYGVGYLNLGLTFKF